MGWGVATVLTGLDAGGRAESSLLRLGCEFYNPKTIEQWVRRGRQVVRSVQLFPGYIFVNLLSRWQGLRAESGITGMLKDSAGPLTIRTSIIDQLRADESAGVFLPGAPPPRFKKDQPVFLMNGAGAFVDKLAIYEGMRGPERSAVMLSMLGKQVRIVVSNDSLREIGAEA